MIYLFYTLENPSNQIAKDVKRMQRHFYACQIIVAITCVLKCLLNRRFETCCHL